MEDILKFLGVMSVLSLTGLTMYAGTTFVSAWGRRLNRREQPTGLNPDEADQLRAQTEEHEQIKARLAEVEERLDFAERMLASRERAALPEEKAR